MAQKHWARSPLQLPLLSLGIAALAFVGLEIALLADAHYPQPLWPTVLYVMVGSGYIGAGLLAWWRRPANRIGALIVAGGAAMLIADLLNTAVPVLVDVGIVMATVCLAVILHLLHAFPSGRLRSTASRVTVATAYGVAVLLQPPLYLFRPGNPLTVADRPDLATAGQWLQSSVGAVAIGSTAVILAGRLRRADRRQRLVLAPVYGYGIFAVLFIPLSAQLLVPLLGLDAIQFGVMQLIVLAGVPLAFTLGVLRGGFARTGQVEELGTWLSRVDAGRPGLTAALARSLGDDSVRVLFWSPRGYVDDAGVPASLPGPDTDRGVVEFEVEGQRVAAICYDATLIADPEPVGAAGRVAAIALAHERLTAELRASEEEVRQSRLRIVEAGDRERRRIARNLHDGLQVRLVLLAMQAQQLASDSADSPATGDAATGLRTGIDAAATELRTLVYEVMPAALVERGLAAAVEDLVDRVPLRTRLDVRVPGGALPPAVESTAYFVVAEALTNALKHGAAHEVSVCLQRDGNGHLTVEVGDDGVGGARAGGGSGLSGLADRVDTLGGTFRLDSPEGGGTRLRVELPCGS